MENTYVVEVKRVKGSYRVLVNGNCVRRDILTHGVAARYAAVEKAKIESESRAASQVVINIFLSKE